jgi:hypothetical protein
LQNFSALVLKVEGDPVFQKLVVTLPDLLSRIRSLKSITFGVNLDAGMMPCEATLVSINSDKYRESPFLFPESWRRPLNPLPGH